MEKLENKKAIKINPVTTPLGKRVLIEEIIIEESKSIIELVGQKKQQDIIKKAKVIAKGILCEEVKVGDIILYDALMTTTYTEKSKEEGKEDIIQIYINEVNIYSKF